MLLEIKNITVTRGKNLILDKISLDVQKGSWTGIIGANGSGKTTLLQAISGRSHVRSGDIYFGGKDYSNNREGLAAEIGFSSNIQDLPEHLTAHELIQLLQDGRVEQHAFLKPILGLDGFINRPIEELSSGTKQKIAIYLAFLRDPRLIILDEPFNWLDPVVAFDLKQAFKQLTEGGLTVITALHDISTFTQYCTYGMLLTSETSPLVVNKADLELGRKDPMMFEKKIIKQLRDVDR